MSDIRAWVRASALAAIVCAACVSPTDTAGPTPGAPRSSSAGFIAILRPSGSGCVDIRSAPFSSPAGDAIVRLHVGEAVAIALVVPEVDVSDVFPWATPQSSDTDVLRPEVICPRAPNVSSLPVSDSVFRAVAVGQVTITAPLSPGWSPPRGVCTAPDCQPLAAFALTVVVSR